MFAATVIRIEEIDGHATASVCRASSDVLPVEEHRASARCTSVERDLGGFALGGLLDLEQVRLLEVEHRGDDVVGNVSRWVL